jgi:hypothetical protein
MPIIINCNQYTVLGIVNGKEGIAAGVSFDPTSDIIYISKNVYIISKPPTCVYVGIKDAKFKQLEGLEENVIPIFKKGMKVTISSRESGMCKVSRTQVPCSPAFAITHYKAQGRTFDKTNADIEVTKGGKFNKLQIYSMNTNVDAIKGVLMGTIILLRYTSFYQE